MCVRNLRPEANKLVEYVLGNKPDCKGSKWRQLILDEELYS